MKNNGITHTESHKISLNIFLIFFIYCIVLLTIANLLPDAATNYFIFFLFGASGISLLFIQGSYRVTLRDKLLEVSIRCFVKVVLRKLDITKIEEIKVVSLHITNSSFGIEKRGKCIYYRTNMPYAIQLRMRGRKSYIISTKYPEELKSLLHQSDL